MSPEYGFELIHERDIHEIKTHGRMYEHTRTGAKLLYLLNEDENKVFGITFRTPPADSTGLPHILEHSVLCGSRKYPLKEPFVELLKGSLQTFLNAFTYPDRTCYPVASQNRRDFLNLIDVYLDAVLHPRLTETTFKQEGWHFELEEPGAPLQFKGVVFNEMKGAYSSPDNLLGTYTLQELFPGNPYAFDAGGDPRVIPRLTYEQFLAFHRRYYHPSNARIFVYGDMAPEEMMPVLQGYLEDFDRLTVDSAIPLQQPFSGPRQVVRPIVAGKEPDSASKGMVTINWLLGETTQKELNFALHILEYILLGMPGSPLRRALIESSLGEDLAGEGLGTELRQIYFATGLKGIDPDHTSRLEALVLDTLKGLARGGIDPLMTEAALNTIEFRLRENNSGHYPRGLLLMLRSLTTWLYDGDPFSLLAFEEPLETVKSMAKGKKGYFEDLLTEQFIDNPHRVTLTLKPDPELGERREKAEAAELERFQQGLDQRQVQELADQSKNLKIEQTRSDPPEHLAAIPRLRLQDLDTQNKLIPATSQTIDGVPLLCHELPTNGIIYLDLGFDLHALPPDSLPLVPLFSRALLEMGTRKEDFAALSRRISARTGGIRPERFLSAKKGRREAAARLFLRAKALPHQIPELVAILKDILLEPALENQERFRQMTFEEKARAEHHLIPAGHQAVALRLKAHFSEAHRAAESMGGIGYILFLRALARDVQADWPKVLERLERIRQTLISRRLLQLNLTAEAGLLEQAKTSLEALTADIPDRAVEQAPWNWERLPSAEGMTVPSQVNYVGKGTDLFQTGYRFHGSALVIARYLRNAWLWNQVRVLGGAYGAFCSLERFSGSLTFVSYRDPNIAPTLKAFDASADFLRNSALADDEREKAIIGTIGELDSHLLPDAKGFVSLLRTLTGDTDATRQQMREEILGTEQRHFREFGDILEALRDSPYIKVLGAREAVDKVRSELPANLDIVQIL